MARFEYYPGQDRLLNILGMDAILVGSAAHKPLYTCKDVDLVVSEAGMKRMIDEIGFYLGACEENWWLYIPADDKEPVIELFGKICKIEDKSKWVNRVTYEEAVEKELTIQTLYGVEIFALA